MDTIKTKLRSLKVNNPLIIALVVSILVIGTGVFLGWYNNRLVPVNKSASAHYTSEPKNPLSFLSNWDGPDYISIAQHGYGSTSQSNFFPLYPLLIRFFHLVLSSWLDSALLISWVSLVIAVYFYIKICQELFKTDISESIKAVSFFVLFPSAVFLIATYTESLFCALALSSIYFAFKKRYWLSGLLLGLATLTHITGAFIVILIIAILIENKAKLKQIIPTLILGCSGLVGYMIYLADKFHKPLAFIGAQEQHGWLVSNYHSLISAADVFNLIFIVLLIASVIYWYKRKISLAIYSFLFLLIPLIGKQYGGFNRYVLIAFPIPLMLYGFLRSRPVLYQLAIALTAISWAYFLFQYAGGYIGG